MGERTEAMPGSKPDSLVSSLGVEFGLARSFTKRKSVVYQQRPAGAAEWIVNHDMTMLQQFVLDHRHTHELTVNHSKSTQPADMQELMQASLVGAGAADSGGRLGQGGCKGPGTCWLPRQRPRAARQVRSHVVTAC